MSAPWRKLVLATWTPCSSHPGEQARPRARAARGRARARSSVSRRPCTVRTASFRMSAVMAPSAHSVPGERGTKTVGMPTSRARRLPDQRARPAEGHQREVPLIDAGAGEDLGEGGVHVRHRDAHDALRRLVHAHAERIGEAADRLLGERAVEAHPAAEESLGVEESRDHEGVGERGVLAAAPVACRAGIGAGALRAHLGHADLVDPRDGAAARADRGDAHHRHHDGDAADLLGRAVARAAVLDHRDVRARPAHVERDEVPEPGGPGDVARPR